MAVALLTATDSIHGAAESLKDLPSHISQQQPSLFVSSLIEKSLASKNPGLLTTALASGGKN